MIRGRVDERISKRRCQLAAEVEAGKNNDAVGISRISSLDLPGVPGLRLLLFLRFLPSDDPARQRLRDDAARLHCHGCALTDLGRAHVAGTFAERSGRGHRAQPWAL
jgi:hypothetical protein